MDLQANVGRVDTTQTQDLENDSYYIAYIQARDELVGCHISKNVHSCLSCEQILTCDIRGKYVEAVYGNMTKGEYGDFDFN